MHSTVRRLELDPLNFAEEKDPAAVKLGRTGASIARECHSSDPFGQKSQAH
jgi:hypothetical protein